MKVLAQHWTSLLARLRHVLLMESIEYGELQASWLAMLWGFWLLFIRDWSVHQVLGFPLPMALWGAAALGLGSLQFYALLSQNYPLRRFASFVAVFLWLFFAFAVFSRNPSRMLWPTALAFAIGSAWGYLRLGLRHAAGP